MGSKENIVQKRGSPRTMTIKTTSSPPIDQEICTLPILVRSSQKPHNHVRGDAIDCS